MLIKTAERHYIYIAFFVIFELLTLNHHLISTRCTDGRKYSYLYLRGRNAYHIESENRFFVLFIDVTMTSLHPFPGGVFYNLMYA